MEKETDMAASFTLTDVGMKDILIKTEKMVMDLF